MEVQNLEVTSESLLSAFVQMPENEFRRFFEEVKKLRQKKSNPKWTAREVEIIKEINETALSIEEQTRFYELVEKRRDEKITELELNELIELTEKSEKLNVQRIELLSKLAIAKNKTLSEIMDALEIRPPQVI